MGVIKSRSPCRLIQSRSLPKNVKFKKSSIMIVVLINTKVNNTKDEIGQTACPLHRQIPESLL